MIKKDDFDYETEQIQPPFRLMSKGLGKNYITAARVRQHVLSSDYTSNVGMARYGLPRYLKKKLQEQYYSRYHSIPKSDKGFYLSLGAQQYKEAIERQKIVRQREIESGFLSRNYDDQERLLKDREQKLIESKKLRYRK